MNDYENIRKMTSDARMIALNTDMPQYKISQLKMSLFMAVNQVNDDICLWWMRLYNGDYSVEDLEMLENKIETYT